MRKIENKTILMKYIEVEQNEVLENLLHRMYIEEEQSTIEIAEKLGVHYHTINSWLKQVGIKIRLPHQKLIDLIEIKRKLEE